MTAATGDGDRVLRSLRAIVALIERHPEEFDALLAALDDVPLLDSRRGKDKRR